MTFKTSNQLTYDFLFSNRMKIAVGMLMTKVSGLKTVVTAMMLRQHLEIVEDPSSRAPHTVENTTMARAKVSSFP